MSKIKLGKTGDSRTRGQEKEAVSNKQIIALKEKLDYQNAEFVDYLFGKGMSSSTVKGYVRDVAYFKEWLIQENVELETVTYADVLHYVQCKKDKVKKQSSSIRINSIKHYFDYLVSVDVLMDNPASSIIVRGGKRKTLYSILSKQELENLYHNFSFPIDERLKKVNWYIAGLQAYQRNKIIIGLLIYQGLNPTDLGRLRLKDLKLREGKIFIPGTRRSNQRELTLEAVQVMDLMEYTLKTREQILKEQDKESDHLIVSAGSGNKINNLLYNLMKKLREQFGDQISYKLIRTSVITYWLKRHNLRQTQYMAGHRYVSSTEAYFINDLEGLSEDITKFHPLD